MLLGRIDLKTGFRCNNNCKFCVQAHKKKFGDKLTDTLKKYLKESSSGYKAVVFTGGEITIRKDIFELIAYSKEIGYETIILQTNGRMLSYKDFCLKAIKAGANEFAIAIHGHVPELHDYLTTVKGSFAQTYKAIKNLASLNQIIVTNTVISKPNYRHLPQIAGMLIALGVKNFQFAFAHILGNAKKNYRSIIARKTLVEPYVKKALDIGYKAGAHTMTEALPYCFMKGYEKYVVESKIPKTKIYDLDFTIDDFADVRRNYGKAKGKQCSQCIMDEQCEGPWREYPEFFGWEEFKPITLKKGASNIDPI